MAGTTTNYAWTYPTSTDLVKDGATAIQTAIQGADTTLFTALGFNYPGLRLVKKQTIGTGVSTVAVTNAFSSTYDNYKVVIHGGSASAGGDLGFSLTGSATGYSSFLIYGGFTSSTVNGLNQNNTSTWAYAGGYASTLISLNLDVFGPNLAAPTRAGSSFGAQPLSGAGAFNGIHNVSTAYTGFTLTPVGGTLTGGTIYVYGYGIS